MIQSHKFRAFPNLKTCLTCFKLAEDPIHVIEVQGTFESANPQQEESRLNSHVDKEVIKTQVDLLVNIFANRKSKELCKGHECPMCKNTWIHDYACNTANDGLCEPCACQSAVAINRPISIEQLAQTSGQNLTGMEISQAMLEHEQFVVINLIKDDKGNDYPDWQERVNVHRRDLKRKIELLKVKEQATSKVVMNKQAEDMTKLSPEEIEQYKRQAGKTAGGKRSIAPKADKTASKPLDAKQAYENMLKGLMADIRKKKPTLSNDEVIAAAERRYQIMKEMDNE